MCRTEPTQTTYLLPLYSRRTLLSSTVCGKDPMVVVGRIGRFSFFCWASSLALTGVARRWSEPFKAAAYEEHIQVSIRRPEPYWWEIKKNVFTYSLLNSFISHTGRGLSGSLSRSICREECLKQKQKELEPISHSKENYKSASITAHKHIPHPFHQLMPWPKH